MKIVYKKPPVWDEVVKKFDIEGQLVIFAYGDKIYNPFDAIIPDDLMVHEETHMRQQEKFGNVKEWWKKYLDDSKFRLYQELEAYQNQYKYAKKNYSRQMTKALLKKISKDLSSSVYGNIISFAEAKNLIKDI